MKRRSIFFLILAMATASVALSYWILGHWDPKWYRLLAALSAGNATLSNGARIFRKELS
jgi:hypothetical protein